MSKQLKPMNNMGQSPDSYVPSREHIIASGSGDSSKSADQATQNDLEGIVHNSGAPWGILLDKDRGTFIEQGMLLSLSARKLPRPIRRDI